ncbi:MAG: phosphatase PAP2 family protein [Dehalococcoidia bacterium]
MALSVLAAAHTPLPSDAAIITWAQAQPVPGLTVAKVARAVGSTEVVLGVGWAAAVALWLARRRREALLLALGLVVLPLAQAGIKELVDRPRPSPPLVELRAGYSSPSFPSGHVMSPTFLYAFALYLWLRLSLPGLVRHGLAAFSLFALVLAGPANVFVGVHWPSDVLGGYAWGLVLLLPLVYALEVAPTRR